jgi:methylglyoxal reductase
VQAKYSILDRALEAELLPLCQQNGIMVQVYSPLEQGLLTGTIAEIMFPAARGLTRSGSSGKICCG